MRFAALSLLSLHSLVNADFTGALVCGTDSCKTEAELLLASPTYNCDGTQDHKVRRAIRRDSARIFASRDGAAALYR